MKPIQSRAGNVILIVFGLLLTAWATVGFVLGVVDDGLAGLIETNTVVIGGTLLVVGACQSCAIARAADRGLRRQARHGIRNELLQYLRNRRALVA